METKALIWTIELGVFLEIQLGYLETYLSAKVKRQGPKNRAQNESIRFNLSAYSGKSHTGIPQLHWLTNDKTLLKSPEGYLLRTATDKMEPEVANQGNEISPNNTIYINNLNEKVKIDR